MSVRIKKVCTYENLQLENRDGSRPRGDLARLQKTFTDRLFKMEFHPSGAGVVLKAKNDPLCTFLIPFANIPYVIVDEGDEKEQTNEEEAETKVIRRRRRRPATAKDSGSEELQESEGGTSGSGAGMEDEISERLPF